MSKKQRIAELERRVAELEARPRSVSLFDNTSLGGVSVCHQCGMQLWAAAPHVCMGRAANTYTTGAN